MSAGSEYTDSTPMSLVVVTPPASLQSIDISFGNLVYQWAAPASHHSFLVKSRDQFLSTTSASDDDLMPLSRLEIVARFLLFLIHHDELWAEAPLSAQEASILILFNRIETDFLRGSDIHTVASELPGSPQQRQTVVQAYMAAMAYLDAPSPRSRPEAALFARDAEQRTKAYAIFGGQGNTTDYLGELRTLYTTYTHFVEPLVVTADQTLQLLLETASVSRRRLFYQGLAISKWLRQPETTPNKGYLLSAPISVPIIGLIQFTNYAIICRSQCKSPGELADSLHGMAGHSQGIVVAALLATVTTWESFDDAFTKALTLLFHIGSAGQEVTPCASIPSAISTETVSNGEGLPSHMLNVSGCHRPQLDKYLAGVNKHLEPHQRVSIGLVNGPTNFVVAGPPLSLCALLSTLRQIKAAPAIDQSKMAFSSRKPEFSLRFLPVSVPFHTTHLESAATMAQDFCTIQIAASELRLPVYPSPFGGDIRDSNADNFVPALLHMLFCEPHDWVQSTVFAGATHVLDFGPGEASGVGALLNRNKEGQGVRVILAGAAEGYSSEFGYRAEVFANKLTFNPAWADTYSPRLVQTAGQLQVETRMTCLLGLPPVMVAGMTPTTTSWEFASAVMNAGYHVELAGGGFHSPEQMTAAIKNLAKSIPVGRGICVNVIYANPKQVRWQVPLIQKLRSEEGMPIDGLTFGAGVPSVDLAQEYMELGFRYLSFKPGSASAINQVIAIARLNKSYPILMQWTGGRGGGHHSYEDFHEPILKLYARVRRCPNIVMLAGSGFGGAQDSYPYLTGTWSIPFGRPLMPFDGILLGSRMMVAKEAKTSRGCKEAIVAAPGVDEQASWEQSYSRPTGGIITVKSEMGEPIHKVATRGVLLWKEMDDRIFNIKDKAKRHERLQAMKPHIIQSLNSDFQKVWFGCDDSGDAVDLEDMTYAQVLRRLVQLLYVSKEGRWIDASYLRLTADFVRRMLSRLLHSSSRFERNFGLQDPLIAVPAILGQCPKAHTQLVTYSDANFLVLLCKRPGQKPPTFVPALDDDFEFWFKKDSLWQSEDLAAVVGEDPGRTCILQGPVAARYSTQVDEPVGDILESISRGYVEGLLRDGHGVCSRPNWNEPWTVSLTPSHCIVRHEGTTTHYHVEDGPLPDTDQWLRALAGRPGTWLHVFLTAETVSQGSNAVTNPVRRALLPAQGMHVQVSEASDPEHLAIAVAEADEKYAMLIRKDGDISVTFYAHESADKIALPLTLTFAYHPEMALHPIHEVMDGRNDRTRLFYYRLWFGQGKITRPSIASHPEPDPTASEAVSCLGCDGVESPAAMVFKGGEMTVSSSTIQDFLDSIEPLPWPRTDKDAAPLDFAMVVAWEAMMKAIFPSAIDGDFLNLVHLSNTFNVLGNSTPLSHLDRLSTRAEIVAIRNETAGRVVEVSAIITRDSTDVLQLVSEFLFRGTYTDFSVCFEKKTEAKMSMVLDSPVKVAVLKSKPWVRFTDPEPELLGLGVVFDLTSTNRLGPNSGYRSVETVGQVYSEATAGEARRVVATVHFQSGPATGNPVMDYLQRHASPVDVLHRLEHPQPLGEPDALRLTAPATNHAYARASGDFNPIHLSRPLAQYAGLPGPIAHGMFTSAAVRQLVERAAGANAVMRRYEASFVAMVMAGDTLAVHVDHVAMREGCRVLHFEAVKIDSGERVLVGEADVDQLPSAYLFTGQGSQTPGMGMDLYATCAAARRVWDEADGFYSETYGFLISDIVKRNPTELVVHFGGRRGRQIRQNYMAMTVEDSDDRPQPLFASIGATTAKHTFRHSAGLLFSTEFAQPALTVAGHAQYAHLESQGLVARPALFAGHSLGEYTALSTVGAIMPFAQVLSVVFYRGLTMQSAVARDAGGRSPFGMMAVNPSRIGRGLATEALQAVVAAVGEATGELLQLVNYNVAGQQYVAAGTLRALRCLALVADGLAAHRDPVGPTSLDEAVVACAARVADEPEPLQLQRGVATIPLEGIDVPFHSRFLLSKMPAFRRVLQRYITPEAIDARRLVGRYVSNVTGKAFDISYEAIHDAYRKTGSAVLKELLGTFDESLTRRGGGGGLVV